MIVDIQLLKNFNKYYRYFNAFNFTTINKKGVKNEVEK